MSYTIEDQETQTVIKVELSGCNTPEVSIQENYLDIRATKKEKPPTKLATYFGLTEFNKNTHIYSCYLGKQYNQDNITCEYKDGELTIIIPLLETSKKRKIEVKT
jgi:HSP20 family molecular chaperone IbpA